MPNREIPVHSRLQLGAIETFKAVADRYLAKRKQAMKPRAFLETERHLLKHAAPLV